MPYYSPRDIDQQKEIDTVARDRNEALATFGKELGLTLSLEDDAPDARVYLLDEWEDHPHWANHRIRVFASAT